MHDRTSPSELFIGLHGDGGKSNSLTKWRLAGLPVRR